MKTQPPQPLKALLEAHSPSFVPPDGIEKTLEWAMTVFKTTSFPEILAELKTETKVVKAPPIFSYAVPSDGREYPNASFIYQGGAKAAGESLAVPDEKNAVSGDLADGAVRIVLLVLDGRAAQAAKLYPLYAENLAAVLHRLPADKNLEKFLDCLPRLPKTVAEALARDGEMALVWPRRTQFGLSNVETLNLFAQSRMRYSDSSSLPKFVAGLDAAAFEELLWHCVEKGDDEAGCALVANATKRECFSADLMRRLNERLELGIRAFPLWILSGMPAIQREPFLERLLDDFDSLDPASRCLAISFLALEYPERRDEFALRLLERGAVLGRHELAEFGRLGGAVAARLALRSPRALLDSLERFEEFGPETAARLLESFPIQAAVRLLAHHGSGRELPAAVAEDWLVRYSMLDVQTALDKLDFPETGRFDAAGRDKILSYLTGLIARGRTFEDSAWLWRLDDLFTGAEARFADVLEVFDREPRRLNLSGEERDRVVRYYADTRRYAGLRRAMRLFNLPLPREPRALIAELKSLLRQGDVRAARELIVCLEEAGAEVPEELKRRAAEAEPAAPRYRRLDAEKRVVADAIVSFYVNNGIVYELDKIAQALDEKGVALDFGTGRRLEALKAAIRREEAETFRWMREYVVVAVAGELRHQHQLNEPYVNESVASVHHFSETFRERNNDLADTASRLLKRGSAEEIRDFLHRAAWRFDPKRHGWSQRWSPSYGGPRWAAIARAGEAMWADDAEARAGVLIDHVFDLEHNGGMIFDKDRPRVVGDSLRDKPLLDCKREARDAPALWSLYTPYLEENGRLRSRLAARMKVLERFRSLATACGVLPGSGDAAGSR